MAKRKSENELIWEEFQGMDRLSQAVADINSLQLFFVSTMFMYKFTNEEMPQRLYCLPFCVPPMNDTGFLQCQKFQQMSGCYISTNRCLMVEHIQYVQGNTAQS